MSADILRCAVARFSSSRFARSNAQTKGTKSKVDTRTLLNISIGFGVPVTDVIYCTQLPLNNLVNPLLERGIILCPDSPATRHAAPGGVRCEIPSSTSILMY
jgi:hypothetical protein